MDSRHAFTLCQSPKPLLGRSWWYLPFALFSAELHALQQQAEEERQALEEHKQLHQQLTSEKASAEERLAREMPELHKLTR